MIEKATFGIFFYKQMPKLATNCFAVHLFRGHVGFP